MPHGDEFDARAAAYGFPTDASKPKIFYKVHHPDMSVTTFFRSGSMYLKGPNDILVTMFTHDEIKQLAKELREEMAGARMSQGMSSFIELIKNSGYSFSQVKRLAEDTITDYAIDYFINSKSAT